jgi:voltage-gated potassium channel
MNELTDISELAPWQKKLNQITFGSETKAGRLFDIILLIVILLSIVGVMLESVPSFGTLYGIELNLFEWVVTIIFTAEYILRLLCVKKPLKYVFSFYGLIDLLSLLPTYVGIFYTGTSSLRVLRCVRLLRVFRILKLSQFVEDSNNLRQALRNSRNKIIVFLFSILLLVIILGTIMYLIEGGDSGFDSIPRSIYWAIVTLTTVGYGDIRPGTAFGQFIASIVMILGYAIIAVPTGIVTNELIKENGSKKLSNHACSSCGKDGHTGDAAYCQHCGSKL